MPRWLRGMRRHEERAGDLHRASVLVPAVAALLAAVVGGAAGYFGAREGGTEAALLQIGSQQDERSRDKRATVYATYLKVSDSLYRANSAVTGMESALWGVLPNGPTDEQKARAHAARDAAVKVYEGSQIELFVYGSDAALSVEAEISSLIAHDDYDVKDPTGAKYEDMRAEFLRMWCLDASPTPRKGCATRTPREVPTLPQLTPRG